LSLQLKRSPAPTHGPSPFPLIRGEGSGDGGADGHDADGGLALSIRNESPVKDKEATWLPALKGPFFMVMRLYWPKAEVLEGKWNALPLKRMQ
jgi:hypothetical protein